MSEVPCPRTERQGSGTRHQGPEVNPQITQIGADELVEFYEGNVEEMR